MKLFAKTLAAVLLVSSSKTVHGQNQCLSIAGHQGRCTPDVTTADLSSCGITNDDILELKNCFSVIGRNSINTIDLSINGLTTIPSDLFEEMTSLEVLNIDNNVITSIEGGAFQHVASTLTNLVLSSNQLETLAPNLFAGMGTMTTLALGNNQMTSLPVDAFAGLTGLQRLLLANNELTTLPAGVFDGVGSTRALRALDLTGNSGLECIPANSFSGGLSTTISLPDTPNMCECTSIAVCSVGACTPGAQGYTCAACPPGVDVCDDPHMQGLRGQMIDWSGVDGSWYCLVTDGNANLHVNVKVTAPLPQDFPDRQLITGLSIMSEGHSLAIEVTNPYNVDTNGCPPEFSPCLANGGLRITVDGEEVDGLLRPSRHNHVVDGIAVSASNLPVECRQFGGNTIWARMYNEMLQGTRQLDVEEIFEDWILSFDHMAAVDWCTQYIAQHSLADVQSNHAIFKIATSAVTVRLNVGTNFQGNGELDWDGRVLPDLEFWQMDVGLNGLSMESESLSGILGETARPVLDKNGHEVMKGYKAFRGTVEDYRVSGPLGTDFDLRNKP